MGIGLALVFLAAGILAAYMFRPDQDQQDMSPATLDSFQMTSCDEGAVVPWLTGYVRTKSNLIWFGNLSTVPETQEAGGKGGGGDDITTGYKYYLDLWHSICLGGGDYGTVTFEGLYVGDKSIPLSEVAEWTYTFNDGTQSTYPTQPGPNANAIDGVAHFFLNQYFLGINVTHVPTFHFIMRCQSSAPLTNANMTNGTNPAARIYDVLLAAGSSISDFDIPSFQTAANYWYNKGYAINLAYSKQKEAREWINHIFTYVDGCLRKSNEDKWYLKAYASDDTSVATLNKEDLVEFSLTRRSWSETYNDFVANFTDKDQGYTRRSIRVQNGANQRLLGYKKQRTVDLTAFIDINVASSRLAEIMKRESYPEAQINFSASLAYEETLQVGEVFTLNHSDYGISNASYRIVRRDVNETDSNFLDFRAVQVVENLYDDEYVTAGNPEWETPTWADIQAPSVMAYFEMPVNSVTKGDPTYIILVQRNDVETGFIFYYSIDGTDYAVHQDQGSIVFAQHGTLAEDYGDSTATDTIDDSIGILYTPTNEDPVFGSIDRQSLFHSRRIAILGGTEIVAFQTVAYEGDTDIRLTGVIRGLLNTPISEHSTGATIWLVDLGETQVGKRPYLIEKTLTDFYLKPVPYFGQNTVDIGDVSVLHIQYQSKAKEPIKPARIVAYRNGDTVTFWVFQTGTYKTIGDSNGAGEYQLDYQSDVGFGANMDLGGWIDEMGDEDFYYYKPSFESSWSKTYDNYFQVSESDAFTLTIRRWTNGESLTISIPEADGTYYLPEIDA
jgi:hypothetical protein